MNGEFADWDRHPPGEGIYYGAAHLIVVNDAADGSLDPGTGNFTVEFRYRTKDKFGNVLQKGQSKTAGGQVKFQQPGGFLSCMFKSPTGRAATKSKVATNDNQWHIARCERTPSQVSLYIDGVSAGPDQARHRATSTTASRGRSAASSTATSATPTRVPTAATSTPATSTG